MAAGSFKIYSLQESGARIPVAGSTTGGGGGTIESMTAAEFEALTTAEKIELYASGVRVIAVDGELDPDNINDMQRFANFIHPVGEIVELTVPTNPATLWGIGTWESYMPGRVLIGAGTADSGTVYEAGMTGGEETHALTIDEMPSHDHNVARDSSGIDHLVLVAKAQNLYARASNGTGSGDWEWNKGVPAQGGDQPHNNMQPYTVVYRWLRVA